MIKIAFCDDDLSVLRELGALMDKYRVERNQDIVYASFNSPLELLTEVVVDRSDTKAYIRELQAVSRNINQIAKRANATGTVYRHYFFCKFHFVFRV